MTDRDAFDDRRRGLEESYFHKKEHELLEKLRSHAREDAARQALGEQAGVASDEILQDLHALGYTADTVKLLHLVPLVHLAWADGSMAISERDLILEAARARAVAAGSAGDRLLATWLAERPSDQFFNDTLRVIVAMLRATSPERRETTERDLLSYSKAIANASGGILGFGAVSNEEHKVLARISEELERAHGPVRGEILPPSHLDSDHLKE